MIGPLPWVLLFFLLFFFGIFFMVLYSVRTQERALQAIFQQLKSTRTEVERLGKALDSLLADREVDDDEVLAMDTPPREDLDKLVPGLESLLLGGEVDKSTVQSAAELEPEPENGLPELKL